MIRVAIADDQELVRTGFRLILDLEADMEVAGEAAGGREAVELVLRTRPDVVLMDVRMPGMDGIDATRRIVASVPETRVLVLTTFDLDEYVHAALKAGASGFLLKDAGRGQLAEGIRSVARGEALLAPVLLGRLLERFTAMPAPAGERPAGLEDLSTREVDVMRLVARGLSNAEIAGTLFIGEATVKTHVAAVLRKLDLRDRVQMAVAAYEFGLVVPGAAP